jgi:hypothetical protein
MAPRKYGDCIKQEINASYKSNSLTDEELARKLTALHQTVSRRVETTTIDDLA